MRTSKLLVAAAAAALAVPLASSPVAAQPAGNQQQAEQLYNQADALFQVRKYEEAAKKFTEAYEAWPVTEFLYNIAQSYRLGGNCKEALYFYERFKKLKKRDDGKDLSETDPKRAEKIDRFITELQACVKQTDSATNQKPDDLTRPDGTSNGGTGDTGTTGTGDTGTTSTGTDVADTGDGGDDDDEDLIEETATLGPTMVSARASAGIALLTMGEPQDINGPKPAINISAGYPLAVGPALLDVGAAFTFTPVPYQTMDGSGEQATLIAFLANAGATYPVTPQIGVRGDLGLGILSFGGLTAGNPFTEGGATTDGALGMFHVRFAVAAEYAINENLAASVTPLSVAYSPAKEGLAMDGITNISFLVGLGYRM
jgi:tetratricopeptide (TPR) repeat protein